jgi:MoxR-like ATPase
MTAVSEIPEACSNIEKYIQGQNRSVLCLDEWLVLLIDEIDKADTDFQDDMLDVLDQMV